MKLFFVLLFFYGSYALACTCARFEAPNPDNKTDLKDNYWYSGRILSKEKVDVAHPFGRIKYKILVETDFSGELKKDTVDVYSSTGTCGLRMEVGEWHLFSSRKKEKLFVSVCDYHSRKEEAQEDILKLKKHFKIN